MVQFMASTKTRKNVFVSMYTSYGVTENENSLKLVTNNLSIDCLFSPD